MMNLDFFFDVDGSLVSTKYDFSVEINELIEIIDISKAEGIRFHLNSNRSIESLIDIYNSCNFNGVIIFENGIAIYNPKTKVISNTEFAKLDKNLLKKALAPYGNTIETETNKLITTPEYYIDKFVDNVFFLEKSREYTMTIYPRALRQGEIIVNQKMLFSLKNILKKSFSEYNFEINNTYKNIIMIPKNAGKGCAIRSTSNESTIVSFGDENADIDMFKNSDFFGCPNNADDNVKLWIKEHGGFISNYKFTKGAIDFILQVRRLYGGNEK